MSVDAGAGISSFHQRTKNLTAENLVVDNHTVYTPTLCYRYTPHHVRVILVDNHSLSTGVKPTYPVLREQWTSVEIRVCPATLLSAIWHPHPTIIFQPTSPQTALRMSRL